MMMTIHLVLVIRKSNLYEKENFYSFSSTICMFSFTGMQLRRIQNMKINYKNNKLPKAKLGDLFVVEDNKDLLMITKDWN